MDGWSILAVRSWVVAVSSSLIFVHGFCILCRWRTVKFSWYFSVLPIDSHGETCHTSSCRYRHIIEIDVWVNYYWTRPWQSLWFIPVEIFFLESGTGAEAPLRYIYREAVPAFSEASCFPFLFCFSLASRFVEIAHLFASQSPKRKISLAVAC